MTNNNNKKNGLNIGDKAPTFETVDVNDNEINLKNLLDNYEGVLIDFFRGNW
jgi:peroxiredoxin